MCGGKEIIEKLSINGKDSNDFAMSDELTVGKGLPIWLVKALTIDFSFNRLIPVTSIFSTASSGVKIVANTKSKSEPKAERLTATAILLFLDAWVNRLASAGNEKLFFLFDCADLAELTALPREALTGLFGLANFVTFADLAFLAGAAELPTTRAGALGNPDETRVVGLDCGRFNYFSRASSSSGTMR